MNHAQLKMAEQLRARKLLPDGTRLALWQCPRCPFRFDHRAAKGGTPMHCTDWLGANIQWCQGVRAPAVPVAAVWREDLGDR